MLKIIKNIFLLSLFLMFVNCDQSSQNNTSSNSMYEKIAKHPSVLKIYEELDLPIVSVLNSNTIVFHLT